MNDPINVHWITDAVQRDCHRIAEKPSEAAMAWREAAFGTQKQSGTRYRLWRFHLPENWASIRRLWLLAQDNYIPTDLSASK